MSKVLVVDDEEMIRNVIREYAEFEGYEVKVAQNGFEAIELCRTEDFDVIVMDIMMPGIDGFTTYEKIKRIKDIPLLVLSAKGEEYDKLYGYSLGIDDYVLKPFSPKELMARLGVIISRNRSHSESKKVDDSKEVITVEGLSIDGKGYTVHVDGAKVFLTLREFDVLYFLSKHPNIVFSRQQLLDQIWGYDYVGDDRTVDTHIKMLRQSLGKYKRYIVTARGVGYKFEII